MRPGSTLPAARPRRVSEDSLDPRDLHIPKAIAEALHSYEKFVVPVFATITTVEDTRSSPDAERDIFLDDDCGIYFSERHDLDLKLMSIQSESAPAATPVRIRSSSRDRSNERRSRQQVHTLSPGNGFESVRTMLRRVKCGSKTRHLSSQSADPPYHSTFEKPIIREPSLNFQDFSFRNSILKDEPLGSLLEVPPDVKPTSLGRLVQREAAKAASKSIRKTASAGDLTDRRG